MWRINFEYLFSGYLLVNLSASHIIESYNYLLFKYLATYGVITFLHQIFKTHQFVSLLAFEALCFGSQICEYTSVTYLTFITKTFKNLEHCIT
jgi:hypothetical protein